METNDIVEQDSDLSIGKVIVIAAGLTLGAIAVKQLVGKARTKFADRRNQDTTKVDETN